MSFRIHPVKFADEAEPLHRAVMAEADRLAAGMFIKVEVATDARNARQPLQTPVKAMQWVDCEIVDVAGTVVHVRRKE